MSHVEAEHVARSYGDEVPIKPDELRNLCQAYRVLATTGTKFTPEEAETLNGILDNTGAKGSAAKRILASIQEKVERFLPPNG